ncbi:hypothetical protein SAMN04487996_12573 [Dyadobacter soli]|uniref:Beta-lactamase-inhibitor-like, PepSY-like n=1 Tax=Dyadobacter soli TaxID=659014 RepID=A0A1G7Y7E9_9BACT|nr:hypothetical protein [Dyadobacter soli]SDG92206.1 hypothetical protein SAMN04487996_12573 [Dyadobacter soli]
MKALVLIVIVALALTGCNDLKDLRPIDPGTQIPETVVNVVKAKFPKGEDLVFKPVLEDKIWEVKLKSDADRYSSLVDYGKMWETFKIMTDDAPSALRESLKSTAFGDGTLSAYTTAYFATTAPNKLIYSYKNENYAFEWSGVYPNVNSSAAFDQSMYRIATFDIGDLPVFVKDSLKAFPKATFVKGYIWVRLDGSLRYYVMGNLNEGGLQDQLSMFFDDKGKLRWMSNLFTQPGVPVAASNLEPVPAQIKQYLDGLPELAGYEYERKLKSNLNGLDSYYIVVTVGGVSRCELYFDKDFQVLNKKYSVILY